MQSSFVIASSGELRLEPGELPLIRSKTISTTLGPPDRPAFPPNIEDQPRGKSMLPDQRKYEHPCCRSAWQLSAGYGRVGAECVA